jgi:heterodisulfide reductase subunit B
LKLYINSGGKGAFSDLILKKYETSYRLPILYIAQLMRLAFGAQPEEVGIQELITCPQEVLGSIGFAKAVL